MKTNHHPLTPTTLRRQAARALLLLVALTVSAAASPDAARAEEAPAKSPSVVCHANGTRPQRYQNYVSAPRRASTRPEVIQIIGERPSATGDGYAIRFFNAEATGAAQGQTVNRATNDLN